MIATVVGTDSLQVHSCGEPRCASEAAPLPALPLGTEVELVDGALPDGGAVGRFLRIRSGSISGYAQDWFLREAGHNAPYFLQGEPGCGRVGFIFNIGVGYPPDVGILDTLKQERVAATMFPMGWWSEDRPPILERMVADGYPIGTHGDDAIELTERDDEAVVEDLRASVEAIEAVTGQTISRLFTPYAAAIDARVRALIANEGFLPVAWTVAAADYGADATEEGVYERVMAGIHDGALIEFHLDGPASAVSTGRALPRLIARLRADGYRFVTVPEMLLPCAEGAT